MSISMYQASTPVFIRMLTSLSAILDQAQAHTDAKKFDRANCPGARPAGVDIPKHPDTETSITELNARIATVIDYIKSFKSKQIDATEAKEIVIKLGPKQDRLLTFTGLSFLQGFAIGNLYFHVTTAYALLRHRGVEAGKTDFPGAP